jgi:hypothetical protein
MPNPKNKEISQLPKQRVWSFCKMMINLGLWSPIDY